jgi:chemotaxis protein CheD
MAQHMVRMAELKASCADGDVLVSLGLGSCVGVALLDAAGSAAGLAHVVLPESHAGGDPGVGKFADTAIPALVAEVRRVGRVRDLVAVLVGGAQMFQLAAPGATSRLDIGARNERAVREALLRAGIPVRAADTGGSTGRTVRVHVGSGLVTCKAAGGPELAVYEPHAMLRRAA